MRRWKPPASGRKAWTGQLPWVLPHTCKVVTGLGTTQEALGHFPPRTSPTCQLSGVAILQAKQQRPWDLFCHHGDRRSHLPTSRAVRVGDSCRPAPWPGEGPRR